jgi:uncharacterized damage-inducible protein DinB
VTSAPEAWLRGPIDGVAAELQPAAHALVQAREDVERVVAPLDRETIWRSVGSAAPVGYHVRHLCGSLDRLLTYARGEQLSDEQRMALGAESGLAADGAEDLLRVLRGSIDRALEQLRATDPVTLADARSVGRAGLPSTVLGLLFHAAEHSTRHAGQVVTTVLAMKPALETDRNPGIG